VPDEAQAVLTWEARRGAQTLRSGSLAIDTHKLDQAVAYRLQRTRPSSTALVNTATAALADGDDPTGVLDQLVSDVYDVVASDLRRYLPSAVLMSTVPLKGKEPQ